MLISSSRRTLVEDTNNPVWAPINATTPKASNEWNNLRLSV